MSLAFRGNYVEGSVLVSNVDYGHILITCLSVMMGCPPPIFLRMASHQTQVGLISKPLMVSDISKT